MFQGHFGLPRAGGGVTLGFRAWNLDRLLITNFEGEKYFIEEACMDCGMEYLCTIPPCVGEKGEMLLVIKYLY